MKQEVMAKDKKYDPKVIMSLEFDKLEELKNNLSIENMQLKEENR